MIKDITKRMSIFAFALIAAITTICGVTGMTANKVSADEAYSETWVIKESWTWTKDVTVTINGKVAGDGCASPDAEFESHKDRDYTFGTFSVTGSGAEDARIKLNGQEISIHSSGENPYFGYPCKLMNMSYDGWVTASGTLTFYADTSAAEYSELRAWLEQNATQIFVQVWYNGDIAQCVSVPLGTTYEQFDKTKAPKRAGYTCIGWSNEENGEVATGALRYSDSSGVLYIQVYPVYAKEAPAETAKYTVTFKDGEKVLYTLSVESGKAVNLSEYPEINESAAKTGYTFKGWSKTNDGSVVNLANETITADTTYYAVFEINKYSITFNDGTSVLKTVTANYGTKASEINVSTFAPEKEGYTFKGWSKTNGGEVVDLSTVTINQSMAFFAVYEKQTFEIKFMDGETLLKTVTVDYGTNLSAISLTGVSTDKTGFTFRGWALSNGGTVVNSETYSVKSAVNFYAVYDVAGKATVVFKNGATSLKTVTVDLGAKASEIDLSDLELEKNGYSFKGWARSENGIIVDLETVSVNEYTIFYAVYEKDSTDTNISSDNVTKIFGVVGLIALGAVLGGVLFKKRR